MSRQNEEDVFKNVCILVERELMRTGKAIISVNGLIAGDISIVIPETIDCNDCDNV